MSDLALYNELRNSIQPPAPTQPKEDSGFGKLLKDAVSQVKNLEKGSNEELQKFMNSEADLHSVMIALEKADLSFQVMMQVRNKIVQAYQEIMRSQV